MACISRLSPRLRVAVVVSSLGLLAACSGGAGPGRTPLPTPPPAPAPVPPPTPAPTSPYDTPEYRDSDGPQFHNAITAWETGASGEGVTLAIIDTGIDTDSAEFNGRILSGSQDLAGNGTVEAEDDHGTHVALLAAAARDNTGIVGMAWGASILALRADDTGSCASSSDCTFDDANIARGVDLAVAGGARVINISLAGGEAQPVLRAAVQAATAAGVIVVIAAGNEGDGSSLNSDPNQPLAFAQNLADAGGGLVIIAGSVDHSAVFSDFSNRAGDYSAQFLSALGEGLCCRYEDGVLQMETIGGTDFVDELSGTSFAAPQITGAIALLAQAFPNLTGAEIVDLLLRTAQDAGDPGADAVYGRGILDLAEAFSPQGTLQLAGTGMAIAPDALVVTGGAAMGDAIGLASLPVVATDRYRRAFEIELAGAMRGAAPQGRLAAMIGPESRRKSVASDAMSVAVSIDARGGRGTSPWIGALRLSGAEADSARVLAARVALQLDARTQLGFAHAETSEGLVAQLQGQHRPAFLVVPSATDDGGLLARPETALVLRRTVGRWGLTVGTESGHLLELDEPLAETPASESGGVRRIAFGLDRSWSDLSLALGLSWQREDNSILGARFSPFLITGGADSFFYDSRIGWQAGRRLRFGASLRQGWTLPDAAGAMRGMAGIYSSGWSLDVERQGVFSASDSIGLRFSQPLRVERGSLPLSLPTGYDYASESAIYSPRRLGLSPHGREIMGEIAWRSELFGGHGAASLYCRRDPGHYADLPNEQGMALQWMKEF